MLEENNIKRLDKETMSGINFIPRYVRMPSDMEYGSIVTHEHYNELLNLNGSQGDYNTEILRLLLTVADASKVPHVKYLDEAVYGVYNEIDGMKEDVQTSLDNSNTALENSKQALDTIGETSQAVVDILTGVVAVNKAHEAERISGIEDVGAYKYYGTNNLGNAGFHDFPPFIYTDDITHGTPAIEGIYYTPRSNSVDETMLTEAVRNKLNRTGITDYDELTGRPSINNVTLTGNKTLEQLGIQPVGSYLTTTDATNTYATKTDLNSLNETVNNNATSANNTFATKTALNALNNTVENNASSANSTFARIFVGSVPSGVTPKTGDMLVTL